MITSDIEFEAKFAELRRFYLATRYEFNKLAVSNERAAELVMMSGALTGRITELLSDIEEYTGAAFIRVLCADHRAEHDRRLQTAKDKERT